VINLNDTDTMRTVMRTIAKHRNPDLWFAFSMRKADGALLLHANGEDVKQAEQGAIPMAMDRADYSLVTMPPQHKGD
jgi:hypothetical protein